jgi:hypothetical protein
MRSTRSTEPTLLLLALDRALRAPALSPASITSLENARRTLADAARAEARAHKAAADAGTELDALMAQVASGHPPAAERFLEVSTRHLEASALAQSASAWADRAHVLAGEALAAVTVRPRSARDVVLSRRGRSGRGREPVTQRSPRVLADVGPRSEPPSQRAS